jgi:hypothetical protein
MKVKSNAIPAIIVAAMLIYLVGLACCLLVQMLSCAPHSCCSNTNFTVYH